MYLLTGASGSKGKREDGSMALRLEFHECTIDSIIQVATRSLAARELELPTLASKLELPNLEAKVMLSGCSRQDSSLV